MTSTPLVRVSIALVKKRALLAPNGASSSVIRGAGEVAGQHDAIVDRDAIVVDRDVERLGIGVNHDAAADVSRVLRLQRLRAEHLRGRRARPAASAIRTGTSPWPETLRKFVAVDEKNDWPSDGARKPRAERRRASRTGGSGCTRTVSLPSTVLPKSRVVLGAAGDAEAQPVEHVAFDVDVAGDAAARLVHLVASDGSPETPARRSPRRRRHWFGTPPSPYESGSPAVISYCSRRTSVPNATLSGPASASSGNARLTSTLADELSSRSVPASNSVLFGGIVGPSDTLSVLPMVKSKLLWP